MGLIKGSHLRLVNKYVAALYTVSLFRREEIFANDYV